jgi:RNA polymerase sigma factor (sigma-70 family)
MANDQRYAGEIDRLFQNGTIVGMDERALLERISSGHDEVALSALIQRHGPMVLSVCRRVLSSPQDVEDAFQATFLILVRRVRGLRDRHRLGPWLHAVAYRVAARARADIARRRCLEGTTTQTECDASAKAPDCLVAEKEWCSALDEEISRLSATHRSVVVLVDLEGQTQSEAARRLGWSEGAVRGRLARARAALRKRLIRRGVAPELLAAFGIPLKQAVAPSVPVALLEATNRAGIATLLAGRAAPSATTAISASVVSLALSVMRATTIAKVASITTAFLAIIAGISVLGLVRAGRSATLAGQEVKIGSNVGIGLPSETTNPVQDAPKSEARTSFDVLVVREADGQAMQGATVRAYLDPGERWFKTERDGVARGLRPVSTIYEVTVDVWADGYQFKRQVWSNRRGSSLGRLPATAKFELKPGELTVGGRIVDEEGKPVPNVELELQGMRPGETRLAFFDIKARTDTDGRWSSSSIPKTLSKFGISVHQPDFLPPMFFAGEEEISLLKAVKERTHVLKLKRGVRVEGRVLDQDDRPIAGATIKQPNPLGIPTQPSTKTDAAGRFVLPSAAHAGRSLTLLTLADGFAPDLLTIRPEPEMPSVDIRLAAGHTIRGRALDEGGKPVPDAWVVVGDWRGSSFSEILMVTDADGRFVWHSAPADQITITVLRWDFAGDPFVATAGRTENVWKLRPSYSVELKVVDFESGKPIKRFDVAQGRFDGTGGFARDERKRTNFYGRGYVNLEAPAFTWRILVTAQGYQPVETRVIAKGQRRHEMEIKLAKRPHGEKGCPSGLIVDSNGTPLSDAEVMLATRTQNATLYGDSWWLGQGVLSLSGAGTVVSDKDGRFTFSPVDEDYRLGVVADIGYGEANREELERTGRIVVQRWGKIEGQVMSGGKPMPQQVRVRLRDGPPRGGGETLGLKASAVADVNGRFTLSRVRPGALEAIAVGLDGKFIRANVNVKPGETTLVRLGE